MPFHIECLANGLILEFFDLSNRYFGDYWHLCLEVRCRVPLTAALLAEGELERACAILGEAIDYSRRLERMGVPSDDVPGVRQQMVEAFLANARPYLSNPAFPRRLAASRLAEARRGCRPSLVPR